MRNVRPNLGGGYENLEGGVWPCRVFWALVWGYSLFGISVGLGKRASRIGVCVWDPFHEALT